MISRREVLYTALRGAAGLSLTSLLPQPLFAGDPPVRGGRRPNIIHVMTDDQGFGDIGYNSDGKVKTPHIRKEEEVETMRCIWDHVPTRPFKKKEKRCEPYSITD